MAYAVPLWSPPTVAVAGGDPFPVRRIYCVGRNYAAHAREMGADPDREPPFFFAKPADAVVPDGATVPYPPATTNLHHEVELVVAIGRGGRDIPVEGALDHVFGYAVGLDMTRATSRTPPRRKASPGTWARVSTAPRPAAPSAARPRSGTRREER